MITKTRLEELIEQGATIYDKYGCKIDLAEEDNFLENIFNIYFKVEQDQLYRMNRDLQIAEDQWYLENLFETKEDAEWELEFGNITRPETLRLPNYKVAKTYIDTDKFILEDNSNFKFLLLSNPDNIIIVDKQQGNQVFNKPLTKENYIEACRLAKKLFLGEKSK